MARGADAYTHRFDPQIQYWSDYYGLPSSRVLKAMLMQESGLDPEGSRQPNSAGAVGLGQFLPDTAAALHNPMTGGLGFDRTDPGQSIMGSAQFFRQGLDAAAARGITGDQGLQFALKHYFAGAPGPSWGPETRDYPGTVAAHYMAPSSQVLDAWGNETSPPVPGVGASPAGGTPVAPPPDTPPATIVDATQQAGFGHHFGDFEQPPIGMIIHHTGGRGDVNGVIQTYQQRNFPAQFVIDRTGTIYQTLPDGAKGQQIMNGWGPIGTGKSNDNTEGVEVIARDDKDVLPVQQRAAAQLVALRAAKWGYDPQTSVWGHGEVNPGHKEADEGMTIVSGIRNGSLPVTMPSAVATTPPPVRVAAAGVGDVEPALQPRSAVAAANVSDPSQRTPGGAVRPDVGDDYWAQTYPGGVPTASRPPSGAAGPPMPWSAVGGPISNQLAPPSLYTASSPQQQAWDLSSTPVGYALMRQLAGNPAPGSPMFPGGGTPSAPPPGTAPVTPVSRQALPPPGAAPGPGPAPIITGPGNVMPPAGGSQGWVGVQGAPGSPSGPAAGPARNVSDEEIQKMTADDVLGMITRQDLTTADRRALDDQLGQMRQQQVMSGAGAL
jgi:hypothetical protein